MQEMQETQVWSLAREDSLETGMATHSSTCAWRILWTEEPGRLQSMVAKNRTRIKQLSTQTHIVSVHLILTICAITSCLLMGRVTEQRIWLTSGWSQNQILIDSGKGASLPIRTWKVHILSPSPSAHLWVPWECSSSLIWVAYVILNSQGSEASFTVPGPWAQGHRAH